MTFVKASWNCWHLSPPRQWRRKIVSVRTILLVWLSAVLILDKLSLSEGAGYKDQQMCESVRAVDVGMLGQLLSNWCAQFIILLECQRFWASHLCGKTLETILEPAQGYEQKHLARAGTKNSPIVVKSKANPTETIVQIVLRHGLVQSL